MGTVYLLSSKSKRTFSRKKALPKTIMKLVSAVAVLAGSAMADKWAKLGDTWSQLAASDSVAEDDRKVMELFTISSVANYGCWCRFNMYKPYKGTAQDVVDEACEQWHKNYDCLHNDYSTNTPFFRCGEDHDYVDVITSIRDPFDVNTDFESQCQTANAGDNCAIQACHVDAVFIRHVVNFLSANTLNMTLSGWYGFDGSACRTASAIVGTTGAPDVATTGAPDVVTTDPAATTATPQPTTDCCGAYPNRYPYKLNNGARACCVDTTYNVNILECCPNNALSLIGDC